MFGCGKVVTVVLRESKLRARDMGNIKLIPGASILLLASSAQASTRRTAITINGMDWAQLMDTNELAGVEVYALCALSITCNGVTQSGIDLTGWTWVKEEQAVGLVNDVLDSNWDGTGANYVDTSEWFDYFDRSEAEGTAQISRGIYRHDPFTGSALMQGLNVLNCFSDGEAPAAKIMSAIVRYQMASFGPGTMEQSLPDIFSLDLLKSQSPQPSGYSARH